MSGRQHGSNPAAWGALFQEAGNVITRASKALKYQVNCD